MLYINKGKEPSSLTEYKRLSNATYQDFQGKDDIRESLLKEQGFLCAYCMRRISIDKMRIEHWHPEHDLTEKERLDYGNMLGCCQNHIEGTSGKKDDICDEHKKGDFITVNPLNKSTIEKIKYQTSSGEICSENEEINYDLDKTLNLNNPRHMLKENRKAVLQSVIRELNKVGKENAWKKGQIQKVLSVYENMDSDGQKKEYAGIVIWYLKKRLRRIS